MDRLTAKIWLKHKQKKILEISSSSKSIKQAVSEKLNSSSKSTELRMR